MLHPNNRRKQLEAHLEHCVHLLRSALIKRAITAIDFDPHLNFWRLILGNHMDIAVLEWCKLFGSHRESTHWKTIVPNEDHDFFRDNLFAYVGITPDEWGIYWGHIEELP